MELGYNRDIYLKNLKRTILQKSTVSSCKQRKKLLECFHQLRITLEKVSKNNVHISTRQVTSKNVGRNNLDFLTIETTLKKVRGNNLNFSTIEIALKKVLGNNVDFSTSKITSKKVRGNRADFLNSEITSKKYVAMTQKFFEIWSSTYRRNIHVESTWIRRGVPVGLLA